jgi:hypothetical protein
VNSDLFNYVEDLKEQVTTLSTSYLTTTQEHRDDISQNRQDISSNLSKINDLSDNRIIIFFEDAAEIASATTAAQLLYEAGKRVSGKLKNGEWFGNKLNDYQPLLSNDVNPFTGDSFEEIVGELNNMANIYRYDHLTNTAGIYQGWRRSCCLSAKPKPKSPLPTRFSMGGSRSRPPIPSIPSRLIMPASCGGLRSGFYECKMELATTDTNANKQKLKSYTDFCIRNKKKVEAGMKHFTNAPSASASPAAARGAAADSD